jgi:DNA-binding SARP family transcriptional activator
MDLLKVYLFSAPHFEYQNTLFDIPRRKSVDPVVYLTLVQQPRSRDTIAALLWSNLGQLHACGALRRAMYSLTKLFSEEVFIANRNTILLTKIRCGLMCRISCTLSTTPFTLGHG